MSIERKLGLVHWKDGIELYLAVVEVSTETGKLVSRSYISEVEVIKYIDYGKYHQAQSTQARLYYSANNIEDILDQVTLFSIVEPERFTRHLIESVEYVYEHSKKARINTKKRL